MNLSSQKDADSSSNFALGITILSIAMVLSACLGLLQEVTYRKYGKAWREGLFYTVSYVRPTTEHDFSALLLTLILFPSSSAWPVSAHLLIFLQGHHDPATSLQSVTDD
jgi:UDP-xylose/UDP-N-acetylglucosamine transporter B4